MNIDEMIEVLKAYKDGKVIQYAAKDGSYDWYGNERYDNLCWNFSKYKYRIKPEPQEFWINVYSDKDMVAHESKEKANSWAGKCRVQCIHVREVVE